jgi:hypothetical protein
MRMNKSLTCLGCVLLALCACATWGCARKSSNVANVPDWAELDTEAVDLSPGQESTVRVAHGKAVKVAATGSDKKPTAGVTARLDGNKVCITAAGNAKPGPYSVTAFGASGYKTEVKVNVRRAVARR